jgi:hypothetical protein
VEGKDQGSDRMLDPADLARPNGWAICIRTTETPTASHVVSLEPHRSRRIPYTRRGVSQWGLDSPLTGLENIESVPKTGVPDQFSYSNSGAVP